MHEFPFISVPKCANVRKVSSGLYNTFGEWTYISPHTRVPPGLSHLGMGPLMIPVFG